MLKVDGHVVDQMVAGSDTPEGDESQLGKNLDKYV